MFRIPWKMDEGFLREEEQSLNSGRGEQQQQQQQRSIDDFGGIFQEEFVGGGKNQLRGGEVGFVKYSAG